MFLSHRNNIRVSWLPKLSIVGIVDIIHCTVGVPTSVWLILVRRSYKWIWVLRKSKARVRSKWGNRVHFINWCHLLIGINLQHNRVRETSFRISFNRSSSHFLEWLQVPLRAIVIQVEVRNFSLFRHVNKVRLFWLSLMKTTRKSVPVSLTLKIISW